MIGEAEALLDQRIDVSGAALACAVARVQQRTFDGEVGSPTMLDSSRDCP